MIPKINGCMPTAIKITKNTKAKVAVATLSGLSVLSTRQAWPYCQGLGVPHNNVAEHPEDYELRLVNGIETYVRKDIPTDYCPKVDIDVPDINVGNDISDHFDVPGVEDFIFHPINSTSDIIEHAMDKTQSAFEHVKDFFENIGHLT